ncbi:hypothetical protein QBC46DRAFT_451301 [Diplogelasinospora grovesii]|uniref:CCHC-type domain-containing protein n=1 Tax=Diplogelasinospora grovesii TaxID=303347 RepID=A0AAN6N5S2_9PEZI|nr:hypothetical protein QBC46DRAFT_451301 [Diplogelasinospora grovesii]
MARDNCEGVAAIAKARKEVRFRFEDLQRVLPGQDQRQSINEPDAVPGLRRASQGLTDEHFPNPETDPSVTVGRDIDDIIDLDNLEAGGGQRAQTSADGPTFKDYYKHVVPRIPDFRYTVTSEEFQQDVTSRAEALAEIYGAVSKKTGPCFPFKALSEEAQRGLPYEGVVDSADFSKLVEQNPEAIFHEFKLRTFWFYAYKELAEELHTQARSLDSNMVITQGWLAKIERAPFLAKLREDAAKWREQGPGTNIEQEAVDQILEQLAEKDNQITDQNAIIAELHAEVRNLRRERQETPAQQSIVTSEALLKHLWNEYHNHRQEEEARDKFDDLQMQPGDDYYAFKNNFVRYAGECQKPKDQWKKEFRRKLTANLQVALAGHYANPRVDFEEYANLGADIAMTYQQAYKKREKEKAKPTKSPNNSGNSRNRNNRTPSSGNKFGGSAPPAPRPRGPTAEEAKKLLLEGRCFICKEKGHTKATCPNKERLAMEHDARLQAIADRFAGKQSSQNNKDNTEQSPRALGESDSHPGEGSVEVFGLDVLPEDIPSILEMDLGEFLGGEPLVCPCTIANDGLSLTTQDALIDSGANGYIFVSLAFAKKLRKILHTVATSDFPPRRIGGYSGDGVQKIRTMIQADIIVQGRTIKEEWMMVVKMNHDLILGQHWLRKHDLLVDSRRRRILFPPEWLPDPTWWKTIPMDGNNQLLRDPKYQEDVVRREARMEEQDQQRRAGFQISKRIKELEDATKEKEKLTDSVNPPIQGPVTLLQRSPGTAGTKPRDRPLALMDRAIAQANREELGPGVDPVSPPRQLTGGEPEGWSRDSEGPYRLRRDSTGWYKDRPLTIAVVGASVFSRTVDPDTVSVTCLHEIDKIIRDKKADLLAREEEPLRILIREAVPEQGRFGHLT